MSVKKIQLIIVVAIVISFIVVSCNFLESTDRRVVDEYTFTFDPDHILQSIKNGEKEVFSSANDNSEPNKQQPQLVPWSQSDFLEVADTFYKYVWSDSLYDWNLNYMSFSLSCSQVNTGFESASFSFFQENNKGFDIERQIDVYPKRKTINAWEFSYNTNLFKGKPVEITTMLITADKALAIADNSGGLEKRLAINNDCEISVILTKNTNNNFEWEVLHSPGLFSVKINPITGNVIK